MKQTAHKICSILLALVSIFGLLAGAFGIKDALAVKDYMTQDNGDPVAQLTDGIKQLKENEAVYADGVIQIKDGEVQLADGAVQLADGEKQLADGKAQLAQGYKDYAAGQKELAAGQKMIDDNTAAYKEGKATLAQIEPIVPYLEQYIAFRDGTIAKLPGFETAQEWFMAIVRPLMKELGLFDIPNDVKDLPKYVTDMVADGKAQLKQYEDGLKQLAEGKKQLAEGKKQLQDGEAQVAQGEKDLAKGYADYEDGQAQLADGKKQLAQFEDGMVQIADGLKEVLSQPGYAYKNGTVVVASPAQKLGEDFDFYKKGDDGKNIKMMNGEAYVDLDKATEAKDALAGYVEDMTGAVTNEIISRLVTSALLILGSLVGLIASLRGLLKNKGFVSGVIAAVLGLGALIGGLATHFSDRLYLLEDGSAAGGLQVAGIVLFALTACAFVVTAYMNKTKKADAEPVVEDITEE